MVQSSNTDAGTGKAHFNFVSENTVFEQFTNKPLQV